MRDLLPAPLGERKVRKLSVLHDYADRALGEALHATKNCYQLLLLLQASFSLVRQEFGVDLGLPMSDRVSRDAHTRALRVLEALYYYSEKYLSKVPDTEAALKREHARVAKLYCARCPLHSGKLPKFCRAYDVVKALNELLSRKKQKS
jgi:hypothetical protein